METDRDRSGDLEIETAGLADGWVGWGRGGNGSTTPRGLA